MEKELNQIFEIRYEREGFHNYMVLKPNQEVMEFEIQMINRQENGSLLPVRYQNDNLYYTVDGLQLLEERMKQTVLDFSEVYKILEALIQTLKELEQYMLLPDSVVLNSEMLYIDTTTKCLHLCYVPGYQGNIQKEFCALMEFLMNRVNHLDDNLVVLIYGVYHITKEDNYSLAKVEAFLKQKQHLLAKSNLDMTNNLVDGRSLNHQTTEQNQTMKDYQHMGNSQTVKDYQPARNSQIVKNHQPARNSQTVKNHQPARKSQIVKNHQPARNSQTVKDYQPAKNDQTTENSRILRYQMGKLRQQRVIYAVVSLVVFIVSLYMWEQVWIAGNIAVKNMFLASLIILLGATGSFGYSSIRIRNLKKHIINIEKESIS